MDPLNVLIWTFICVVILTALITFLGLLGVVRLGGGGGTQHHYYLKKLFQTLIVEVMAVAVSAFGVYLTNRNEQIAGLKELVQQSGPVDTFSFPDDTVSVPVKPDSIVVGPVRPGLLDSFRRPVLRDRDRLTALERRRSDSLAARQGSAQAAAERDTIRVTVYAANGQQETVSRTVAIPPGSRYAGHSTRVTTSKGRFAHHVSLIRRRQNIVGVKITARAGERSLFGPRNWVGVVLQVYVER